ncbi:hypothetical protein Enr13x_23910 [Stieleria neptunia]|uniref:Uncharacterized protein n=2 Tax=Stieleria neptunia TaxID=2527979 RepID=A0A518HNX2_9BACT|nr:hypothetical protein Enr13x_23910 [Stieleria neptunia]
MEDWLKPSERTLIDEHGDAILLEQFALFWEQFDELVEADHFTEAELIQFGHDTVAEFHFPFNLAIQDAVGHLYLGRFGDDST